MLKFHLKGCTQATKWSASVIKVRVEAMSVRVSRCLKKELVYATDKWLRVISNIMLFKK